MKNLFAIIVIATIIGLASGNAAFDQNKALKNAGNVGHAEPMALSGTSSEVFNFTEFQQGPLNPRRPTFEDLEWQAEMQGYDYAGMVWSLRDFIDYEAPL
jgi:hypothetical protein